MPLPGDALDRLPVPGQLLQTLPCIPRPQPSTRSGGPALGNAEEQGVPLLVRHVCRGTDACRRSRFCLLPSVQSDSRGSGEESGGECTAPVCASQTRAVLSELPLARRSPSGAHARDRTQSVCPLSVWVHTPSATFHSCGAHRPGYPSPLLQAALAAPTRREHPHEAGRQRNVLSGESMPHDQDIHARRTSRNSRQRLVLGRSPLCRPLATQGAANARQQLETAGIARLAAH